MTVKYDLSYFEDEVREGFYIPGMMKRLWAEQLDILEKVRQICDRHQIKWFADYGTLIGSARHAGYIPWDDDLDICMLREDLNRFMEVAQDELPKEYLVLDAITEDRYENFLVRITNGANINFTPDYLAAHNGYPFVAGIDIFPLDYIFEDEVKEKERCDRAKKLFILAGSVTGMKRQEYRRKIMATFLEAPGEGAKYVAPMYFWTQYGTQKYSISFFEDILEIPFEGGKINVPAGYTAKLNASYGSWERAVRQGGLHDYPSYCEQEDILKKHLGGVLPYKYQYSEDDLNRDISSYKSNTETCLELLDIIDKANRLLKVAFSSASLDEVTGLLTQCQDLAIRVGTIIEFCNGLGTREVTILEEYCEAVFAFYEKLAAQGGELADAKLDGQATNASISESDFEVFVSLIDEIRLLLQEKPLKKVAIFISYKHSLWKRMESVYEEYAGLGDYNVKVCPTPYFYKTFNGTLLEERNEYELFDEDLPLIKYEDVDFNFIHADVVVYQNAFDQWNAGLSLHPQFSSENLAKISRELVYIPDCQLEAVSPDDAKGLYTSKYYIVAPGVIRADRIIVDNDELKKLYVDTLTEATGQDKRPRWEGRVEVIKRKEANCGDKASKKRLLFSTTLTDLYSLKEEELNKIDRVIDVFKESQKALDITWKLDENFSTILHEKFPEYEGRYLDLIDKFKSLGLGDIEIDQSVDKLLEKCDAFYGGKGYAMNLAIRKRIPVMIMNISV